MSEGFEVMRAELGSTAAAKPQLRGHSHAVAAILSMLGTVQLLRLTAGDPPKQLTMLIYGASGYHELFHLVVVVASTLVFLFMLQDVVPFVRR
jgi:predicted membrane channel-forming protein YqfA (hemolysin III family)